MYDAYWRSRELSRPEPPVVPPDARPYRNFYAFVSGPDPGEGQQERLSYLSMRSAWVPRDGWVAKVTVSRGRGASSSPGPPCSFSVSVDRANKNRPYVFGRGISYGAYKISLMGNHVSASAHEKKIDYGYSARLPRSMANIETEADFRSTVKAVYSSPESLRDYVLAQLDTLRKKAAAEIPKLEGVSATDFRGVKTDNPPQEASLEEYPPGDEIKAELLAKVNAELDRREELIRAEHVAIHTAITTALSLRDLERILAMELQE